jgi:hypothetical protein
MSTLEIYHKSKSACTLPFYLKGRETPLEKTYLERKIRASLKKSEVLGDYLRRGEIVHYVVSRKSL